MNKVMVPNYVQLMREEIYKGHLILVNNEHPVRVQRTASYNERVGTLEQTCERQLGALLNKCNAMDKIVIVSGYRSKEEQKDIYESSVLENGIDFTKSYVARPGESEHQTGLAVDVGENIANVDFIRPSFPDHGVCKLFKQLAAKYGFIQRYQKGKEHITNIACEPWHYRYIGYPHAIIMGQKGLCLEEYTDYIKQYTPINPYCFIDNHGSIINIYYVPAEKGITSVPILESDDYQLSGNNKDGFVVTACHMQGSDNSAL